jgi:hypothetical protein
MKLIIWFFVFYSSISLGQTINEITFAYLPWGLNTQGRIDSNSLVNEFKYHSYSIKEDSVLLKFQDALSVINFVERGNYSMDVRMIMTIHLSDETDFILTFSSDIYGKDVGYVKTNECFISENETLNSLIREYVPEKLTLPDRPSYHHVKKGELTDDQIKEYNEKGITVIEDLD